MGKPALLALLLPALLAGCLGGERAEPGPLGQIDGAVVDHLLRPYADQTVFLTQLGLTDQTSRLGGFTFRDVPVGTYTLLATREGTQGDVVVVEVTADHITKTILQLVPIPTPDPYMAILTPQHGSHELPFAGEECTSCGFTIPLDGAERPAEVVLDARWERDALGRDGLVFEISDDLGNRLWYHDAPVAPPLTATVDGADIAEGASELRVRVFFGHDFATRLQFQMDSYMTLYYGATRAELFG